MTKVTNIPLRSTLRSRSKEIKQDLRDKVYKRRHFSVGAVIKKDNKYLIINRNLYPPGYAGIAGHVNKDELPSKALRREVKEETNYSIKSKKLLFHEIVHGNECRTGITTHEWYLYECKCRGRLKILKREEKSIKYMAEKQIQRLYKQGKLEPVWEYWFKKLSVIK